MFSKAKREILLGGFDECNPEPKKEMPRVDIVSSGLLDFQWES
jgi:hypothetical protein